MPYRIITTEYINADTTDEIVDTGETVYQSVRDARRAVLERGGEWRDDAYSEKEFAEEAYRRSVPGFSRHDSIIVGYNKTLSGKYLRYWLKAEGAYSSAEMFGR